MYLVKYILLNTVCHSYTILFIAVSIKNIVDMSSNKQFVKTCACVCHLLDVTAVRQDIASAVWRVYSQLAYAARNPANRCSEGRKISALPAQNYQRRPPVFLHVFGRAPSDLQLCFVQLKTLALSARYSTFKYPVILKPGLEVTQGHRKYQ